MSQLVHFPKTIGRYGQPHANHIPGMGGHATHRLAMHRLATLASQLAVAVIFAAVWQGLVQLRLFDPFWVSTPMAVASAVVAEVQSPEVLAAIQTTLYETVVGFLISVLAGLASGFILFEVGWLYRAVRPYIALFNNLPRLVLAPIFVLYFGIGLTSRVALVVSVVYIIVLLNTLAGLQASESDHLRLAKALGAGRVATFTKFRLPAATPTIFVGLQVGLNFALVTAIVAEVITGGDGLGALVTVYGFSYQMDRVFAGILIMALLGTILSVLMQFAEDRILSWRRYEFRGLH